jgi:hypothetical protein
MPNVEGRSCEDLGGRCVTISQAPLHFGASSFGLLSSFGFRHSSFIPNWLCLAVVLPTLSACSSGPEPTYPVQGVVKVDGEPLEGGSILFEPVQAGATGKHHSARGTIDSTGHYTLSTFGEGDGAVAGRHHVMVFEKEVQVDDPNLVRYTIIPDEYHTPETTPLVIEVKPESNEIDVPIERD